MRCLPFLLALLLSLPPAAGQPSVADNWPSWRGPDGTCVADGAPLPAAWSEDDVAWRAPLPGLGISSPIVWGDRVMVTYQVGRTPLAGGSHPTLVQGPGEGEGVETSLGAGLGDAGADDPAARFAVAAFRRADGERLWEHGLPASGHLQPVHRKHNLASPSPATDGEVVVAWFGTGQLVALDLEGQLLWERHLGEEIAPFELGWGHSSSPTLHGDLVFLLAHHEPAAYLLALDRRTGEQVWRVDRGGGRSSYSTPTVVEGPAGAELVVNSSEGLEAFDPATGETLWRFEEANRFPIPVPTHAGGVLYTSRGYRSGPYMALRLGGRGDVSDSHVEWHVPTGAPYVSSILHYRGLIYMANGGGVVTVVDAATGERVGQERVGGVYTASPVAGDGKVYLSSEDGVVVVLEAGPEPRVLARNDLGERILASPALAGGQIFVRSDRYLIRIGD